MEPTEADVEAYLEDLIEKGAYRVDGYDPATGERLLVAVPEVMKQIDPELYEILEIESIMEVEATLHNLEQMGLVERVDEEHFTLTEEGQAVAQEIVGGA